MADKAFIDSIVRLRNLYEEASKEPFPIKDDAYPLVTKDQIEDGKVIYGLSPYCTFPPEDAVDKFKEI